VSLRTAVMLMLACSPREGTTPSDPAPEPVPGETPRESAPAETTPPMPPRVLSDYTLTVSCEMHGFAITRRKVVITGKPETVEVTRDPGTATKTTPPEYAMRKLARLLGSPEFYAWSRETPTAGVPHPGMELCRLTLASRDVTADSKWTRGEEFSSAGQAVEEELWSLVAELAPP
jgi:hypothetical protein